MAAAKNEALNRPKAKSQRGVAAGQRGERQAAWSAVWIVDARLVTGWRRRP